jgi:TolB-like protein/Tfp pilus assembly protein PilF
MVWENTFVEEGNLSRHVSTLRKVLNDDLQGQRFIKTIPKIGYRFTGAVRERVERDEAVAIKNVARSSITITEETTESFWTTTRLALACVLVIAGTLTGIFVFGGNTAAEPRAAGPGTLAVIPFRNIRPDADSDFLGYALAQSITGRLGYVRDLIVRPTRAGEKLKDADASEIAIELKVRNILMGSFLREGDTLRINVELIDADENRIRWQNSFDLPYEKLATVQERVANDVVRGLSLNLSNSEKELVHRYVPHPTAYEYDLRGLTISRTSDYRAALGMYEKAIEIDPQFALAWTHVAEVCYFFANDKATGRQFKEKAENALNRALELEPHQIEARLERAFQMVDNEGRGEEAIPILRGIIDTNDNNASAHWFLSEAYRYGGMLDASIAEGERALQIDPDVMRDTTFNSLFYAGQYERFLNSMALKPDGPRTSFYRGLTYLYLNEREQAAKEFEQAYALDPTYPHAIIGYAIKAGLTGENGQGIKRLEQFERDNVLTDGEMLYKVAQAYALLGYKQEALRLLERAIQQNFICYPYFERDPLLENMRDEPHFAVLLKTAKAMHEEFSRKFL